MTRPIFHRPSTRRAAAGFAAVTLAFTLASCAEGGDGAIDTATSIGEEATDIGGDTATEEEATTGEGATEESAAPGEETTAEDGADAGEETTAEDGATEEGAAGEDGESTEIQTADGNTVLVDPAFGDQINQYAEDWGEPEQVQEGDAGAVATFADGNLLAHSEEGGVQPIVGMIAQTWTDDGGLDNSVGMPTGPEEENDDGSGWVQEFTEGTITWAPDESGEFGPTVS